MTSLEGMLRRVTMGAKLNGVLKEIEDRLHEGRLTTPMDLAISLKRIEFMFQPIQKLDEDICHECPQELDAEETSEVTMFSDSIVKIMAELRYRSRAALSLPHCYHE